MPRFAAIVVIALMLGLPGPPAGAVVLWSDLGSTRAHDTGAGSDILGGVVRRDENAADTLYFKFHLNPLSDVSTEEYFAGFQLFEDDTPRLGVGNSLKAWAYSAFNTSEIGESNKVFGDFDLRSSQPESKGIGSFFNYELPRKDVERTIVFKVQYVPGKDDLVTVWLNPDLSPGATEESQTASRTTTFKANACFDQIRLMHGGGGPGWEFSDMAIATSFSDFITQQSTEAAISTHITYQTWTHEQGLPQNSVLALAQSADGYLWIGTEDGLARFDGVQFASFGMKEGVPNGPVSAVMEDSRRMLWIGTQGSGLVCRHGGRFVTYTARDGLPSDSITALAEDSEGKLWVGTEAGLVVWDGNSFSPIEAAEAIRGRPITTLYRDRSGTMWIGARFAGVFHFLTGKFRPVTDPAVDDVLPDPHAVLVDQSVRLWIAAGDDFVLCREGQQWRRFRIPHHLARPYVSSLAEEPDGTIWAGSMSEGLVVFTGGKLSTITASSGLSDNFVESLLVDREGNLWVGAATGLNRLRHSNLSVSGPTLGYGAVQGLAEIEPGMIWAGKPGDGLYESRGKGFSRITVADLPRFFPDVNALLKTRDGACWVGCSQGLLRFQDPRTPSEGEVEFPELSSDVNVVSLAADHSNGVWAGARDGALWHMTGGNWTMQTNFSQPHAVTALAQNPDGSIWIGTEGGGMYRFKDKVLDHLDEGRGLSSMVIRTFLLDDQGTLWIGTAGGGLCWLHGGRLSVCTAREGMPDDTISQILEDDSGRLWVGSNRGIARVKKHDLEDLADKKTVAVYPQVYGRAEGMLSEECTGGFFPAGLKTQSGQLWFSTMKGIVVADPSRHSADQLPPDVLLEEVVVDAGSSSEIRVSGFGAGDTNAPVSAGFAGSTQPAMVTIPPGKHRVEFRYTAPSFIAPERIRFRCKLEGLDTDWTEAGTLRTAPYNYLPPGQYRFRVSARTSGGDWNEHGAELPFRVMTYFWQTTWFRVLSIAGLLVLAGGTVRVIEKNKLHRRLAQVEQERALERERARIAQDLHDDLGSSLAHISLLSSLVRSDKEQPGLVEKHADKIFKSADQTVRALEEIVWAVRPGADTLQSLVEYIAHFANELFEGNRTRCRLDLPHDLPALTLLPEIRHNMFLVVKEALTNALKHADATEVRVSAKATRETLEFIVEDDGKGFHAPEHFLAKKKRDGLANMRHRAEAIGGRIEFKTAPGQGTRVRLIVNLNQRLPLTPGPTPP